jgi:N-glycosylase/DNA lyase
MRKREKIYIAYVRFLATSNFARQNTRWKIRDLLQAKNTAEKLKPVISI